MKRKPVSLSLKVNPRILGRPLPFPAWIWRRRATAEVLEIRRSLRAYRDAIRKHQASLANRVTGIDEALMLMGQAADRLESLARTTAETTPSRRPGRPRKTAVPAPGGKAAMMRRASPASSPASPGGPAE